MALVSNIASLNTPASVETAPEPTTATSTALKAAAAAAATTTPTQSKIAGDSPSCDKVLLKPLKPVEPVVASGGASGLLRKMRELHLPPFLENIGRDLEKKMKETPNFTYPNFPEDKVISTEIECFLQPESPQEYSYSNVFRANSESTRELETLQNSHNSNNSLDTMQQMQQMQQMHSMQSMQSLAIDVGGNDDDVESGDESGDSGAMSGDAMILPLTPANSSIKRDATGGNGSNSILKKMKSGSNNNSNNNENVVIDASSLDGTRKSHDSGKHGNKHKSHSFKHKHKHRGHRIKRSSLCAKISHYDHMLSRKVHELACGAFDYLFVFGAFVFGSKFMPITILLSIFIVNISGFLFTGIACTITVTITEFGKKYFARHRPDPTTFGPKVLDFRTRLTNFSFPSGDTAQAASYSTALFFLTNNGWLLLLIPNCAWGRIYFGCHYIGDCVAGALIGCAVPALLWTLLPNEALSLTQDRIEHWIYGL